MNVLYEAFLELEPIGLGRRGCLWGKVFIHFEQYFMLYIAP